MIRDSSDEIYFWRRVRNDCRSCYDGGNQHSTLTPRAVINEPGFPLHPKRARRLLEKWWLRGIYEFGISLDLGWVTPEGLERDTPDDHLNRPPRKKPDAHPPV